MALLQHSTKEEVLPPHTEAMTDGSLSSSHSVSLSGPQAADNAAAVVGLEGHRGEGGGVLVVVVVVVGVIAWVALGVVEGLEVVVVVFWCW